MAYRLGISQNCYSKLESGKTKLSIERKEEISDIFDLQWEEIENYHLRHQNDKTIIVTMQKKIEALETDVLLMKNAFNNIIYNGGGKS